MLASTLARPRVALWLSKGERDTHSLRCEGGSRTLMGGMIGREGGRQLEVPEPAHPVVPEL